MQPETGQTACVSCTAGTFDDGTETCAACAVGEVQPEANQTACQACGPGTFDDGSEVCAPCATGTFQPEPGQDFCQVCADGATQEGQDCVICEPGTFADGNGACIACDPGTSQPNPGQTECAPCAQGEVQPEAGQAACVACEPGTIDDGTETCAACAPGEVQPEPGQEACTACQPGTFDDGTETCALCPRNTFGDAERLEACTPCQEGQFQDLPGQRACRTLSVLENAVPGFSIGTIQLADGLLAPAYSILAQNPADSLAIDPTTGALSVAATLDFETAPLITLTVQVDDSGPGGSGTLVSSDVLVHVENITPAIEAQSFAIPESAPVDTSIGAVVATGDLTSLGFSILAGNEDAAFDLNAATGELTLLQLQDTETTPERELTVGITDGEGEPVAQAAVTVVFEDEAPLWPPNPTLSVDEMSAVDAEVGVLTLAPEGDQTSITFSITGGSGAGAFALAPQSGLLTVTNPALDFEATPSLTLDVRATDGRNEATTTVTINLVDVAPALAAPQDVTLPEQSPAGTVVANLTVASGDTSSVRFILLDAGGTSAFAVDTDGTVRVTPSAVLDFETRPSISLSVGVSDQQGPLPIGPDDVATFTVNLSDIAPTITAPETVTLQENAPAGMAVVTASQGPGDSAPVHYTIVSGNESGAFTIAPDTGQVTIAALDRLDAEGVNPLPLEIGISDNPEDGVDDTTTVLVNITNVAPIVLPTGPFSINESAPEGTFVGEVTIDPAGDTSGLSFSFAGGNFDDAFGIDPDTGVIRVLTPQVLDYEGRRLYQLQVTVSDGVTAQNIAVEVSLEDAPVLINSPMTIQVSEGANVGDIVGRLEFQEGSDQTSIVTNVLAASNQLAPPMRILPNADIELAQEGVLDFESLPSFSFLLSVRDGNNFQSSILVTVLVEVLDAAPRLDPANILIPEDIRVGEQFGPPGLMPGSDRTGLHWNIAPNDPRFTIDSRTGLLTLVEPGVVVDFEAPAALEVSVGVRDTQEGVADETVAFDLTIGDVAPQIQPAGPFLALPAHPVGHLLGTLALEGDRNSVTWSILSGNESGAFALATQTGALTLATPGALAYAPPPAYALEVQATDGTTPNTRTIEVNVTGAPGAYSAVVTPPTPGVLAELTCEPDGIDPDGTELTWTYRWFVDGVLVNGAVAQTTTLPGLRIGDEVTCEATPSSQGQVGNPVISTPTVIANTPPTVTFNISPDTIDGNTPQITCSVSITDPDVGQTASILSNKWDAFGFGWARGPIISGDGSPLSYTLTGDNLFGRRWTHFRCSALVTDGVVTYETSQVIARSGSPPTVGGVNLVATTRYASCAPFDVVDPDGPQIERTLQNFDYRFNNGAEEFLDLGWTGASVFYPAVPLRRGELAECRYTVTDWSGESTTTDWVSSVVISDPPNVPFPRVIASGFEFCDDTKLFYCNWPGATDFDNDIISSEMSWTVNGVDQGISSRAAEFTGLRDGDVVLCHVSVSDPDTTIERTSFTPAVIVQPPSAAIEPPVVTPPGFGFCATRGTYTCEWSSVGTDVCGGALENPSFRWLVNGQDTGITTPTYEANGLENNAEVTCEVTVMDRDRPLVETATHVINGTPPVLSPAVITGPPPGGCQGTATYTCSWTQNQDLCGDDPTIDGYTWTINGQRQQETGPELTVTNLFSNSTIECEVALTGADGPVTVSGSFLVTEAAPTINGAPTIDPAIATVGEVLNCEVGTATSVCGEELTAAHQWVVNGTPLEGATEATLSTLGLPDTATIACFSTWTSSTGGVATAFSSDVQLNPGNYAIESPIAGDLFGYGVAVVGDLNRDGLDDVAIGAPSHNGPAGADAGRVYLFYGQSGFGSLSSQTVTPNTGFVYEGTTGDVQVGALHYYEPIAYYARIGYDGGPFGEALGMTLASGAGDFTGDGTPDLVVAAPYGDRFRGHINLINGSNASQTTLEAAISDASPDGLRWTGVQPSSGGGPWEFSERDNGDLVGASGNTFIGDFDGDGFDDLVVGSGNHGPEDHGAAYLLKGGTGMASKNLTNMIATEDERLIHILGTSDSDWASGGFGELIGRLGDIDNDGLDDVLLSPSFFGSQTVRIVLGRTEPGPISMVLGTSPGVIGFTGTPIQLGIDEDGYISVTAGYAIMQSEVGGDGDLNGDGFTDFVMRGYGPQGATLFGVYGAAQGPNLNMEEIIGGVGGFFVEGVSTLRRAMPGQVALIDIDADGYDDIAFGDPYANNNAGEVGFIFGGQNAPPAVGLEALALPNGFEIASPWPDAELGTALAAGDINGDGLGDVILGSSAGRAMVVLGRDTRRKITHRGTPLADTLVGTLAADIIVGDRGDDLLQGEGGMDAISGGAGDDTIAVGDTSFVRVDGGGGTNTLVSGGGLDIDIIALGKRLQNISIIDLRATGTDTLTLDDRRLYKLNRYDDSLIVRGTSEDSAVVLGSGWRLSAEPQDVDGVTYTLLTNGRAKLYLEATMAAPEVAPTIETTTLVIPETAQNGETFGPIEGFDADGEVFQVTVDDPSGTFGTGPGNTLQVINAANLNFEQTPRLRMTLTATDGTGQETTRPLLVVLTNIDEPPVIDPVGPVTMEESPPVGEIITTLSAMDPEGTALTWVVLSRSFDAIDVDDQGVVRVKDSGKFDFETSPTVNLELGVSDSSGLFSFVTVPVELTNVTVRKRTFEGAFVASNRFLFDPQRGVPARTVQLTERNRTANMSIPNLWTLVLSWAVDGEAYLRLEGGTFGFRQGLKVEIDIPDEIVPDQSFTLGSSVVNKANTLLEVLTPAVSAAVNIRQLDMSYQGSINCSTCTNLRSQRQWRLTNLNKDYRNYPQFRTGEVESCGQGDPCVSRMFYSGTFSSATMVNSWAPFFDLALGAAGLPLTYGTYNWGFDGFNNVTYYELFRSRMEGQISSDVNLQVEVEQVDARLLLEDGSAIPFIVGTNADVTIPLAADVNGDGIVEVDIELSPKASYTNTVVFRSDLSWIMDTGKWDNTTYLGNSIVGQNSFPGTSAAISPTIETDPDVQGGAIPFDVPTMVMPTVLDLAVDEAP